MNYVPEGFSKTQLVTYLPFCSKRLADNPALPKCRVFLNGLSKGEIRQCPYGFCGIRLTNSWLCGFTCNEISDERKTVRIIRDKSVEKLTKEQASLLHQIDCGFHEQEVYSYFFHDITHTVGVLKTHIEQCKQFISDSPKIRGIITAYDGLLNVYKSYQEEKLPKCNLPQNWFLNVSLYSDYYEAISKKNGQSKQYVEKLKAECKKADGLIELTGYSPEEEQELNESIKLHELRSLSMMSGLFRYRIDYTRECLSLIRGDEPKTKKFVPVNLYRALYKLVMFMKTPAKNRNLAGVYVEGQEIEVSTSEATYLGFYILLENAVKYALDQTKVLVFIECDETGTKVLLQNKSDPISSESMSRLEENGFSGENSINKESHGFGLSIVKRIFSKAGAEVTYSYNPKTSLFTVQVLFKASID